MQTALTLSVAVAASLCISTVLGYKFYQNNIPNGKSVPNPSGGIWEGVGHEAPEGKGPRNQFGVDFKDNNNVWNAALCNKDSDGDGPTNGQELGDPLCQWTQGGSFTPSPATGHPGLSDAGTAIHGSASNASSSAGTAGTATHGSATNAPSSAGTAGTATHGSATNAPSSAGTGTTTTTTTAANSKSSAGTVTPTACIVLLSSVSITLIN